MLIEFSVANFRSIGDEQVLSLVPESKQKDFSSNVIEYDSHYILNGLALYGPNAGGKSNILRAFDVLEQLLFVSTNANSTAKLPYYPFLLREGYGKKPTKFEITFYIKGTRYRYGLEYNSKEIVSEWLYRKVVSRETELFLRDSESIDVSSGLKASKKIIAAAIEATRKNALFLSFCDLFNIMEVNQIFSWFHIFRYTDGLDTQREAFNTFEMLGNKKYQPKIKEYLKLLNLGIEDIQIQQKEFDPVELPLDLDEGLRQSMIDTLKGKIGYRAKAIHKLYNKSGKATDQNISWSLEEFESAGTIKAFHLSGPIIHSLLEGGVLVIDEFESKLHPLMTMNTINLFLDKKTNPNNAQLIFATHDTNILKYGKLRRDQINFVEKNEWESTEIFALSDMRYRNEELQTERPDKDKEKRYLEGRYGAIPNIHLDLFESLLYQANETREI